MEVVQRGFRLLQGNYMEDIEPALEFLYENTAHPALTGNEVNCFTM